MHDMEGMVSAESGEVVVDQIFGESRLTTGQINANGRGVVDRSGLLASPGRTAPPH